ncbi:MAG TPA: ABC transporter permease [Bacteroidales bacterium]|nr:ABC transporter permease [Bacteroidales bacterium]HPS28106.1 ABC transporter permease [Bacteroidales bacterium]
MEKDLENWTEVIRPRTNWFNFHLRDVWRYRDLLLLFVRRDFVSIYKQTILGPLWYLLQALFTTITYTIIFGRVAKLPTDGVPQSLFYMAGVVCWSYFSLCLTKTSNTFISNAGIFGKVYFPRLTVPISIVISNLVSFGIQLLMFLGFLIYFYFQGMPVNVNTALLLFPILIIIMACLGLGIGIIISSLTTKYRDLQHLVTFGVQLLMYATPVIFPLSFFSGKLRTLVLINPMTSIVETFKYAFLGSGTFNWFYLGYSAAFAIVVLLLGIVLFNRIERSFMDTV